MRSEPVTVAPRARATSARPLIPAPPMPTKCSRRPAHGGVGVTPRSLVAAPAGSPAPPRHTPGHPAGSPGPPPAHARAPAGSPGPPPAHARAPGGLARATPARQGSRLAGAHPRTPGLPAGSPAPPPHARGPGDGAGAPLRRRPFRRGAAAGRSRGWPSPWIGSTGSRARPSAYESLRPGQREAIEAVLAGRDTLVVMSTGSGKSAIYQIAGLLMPGATVVVSPLIALQREQVEDLRARAAGGAAQLNSTVRAAERDAALAELAEDALEFVFLAPEQLANPDVLDELAVAQPSLLVVDEAHCISEWGHDFRPEYLRLGAAAEALGRPTIVALTATAAPPVREEIVERLGLRDPEVLVRGFDRPNIRLSVRRFHDDEHKQRALREHVAAAPPAGHPLRRDAAGGRGARRRPVRARPARGVLPRRHARARPRGRPAAVHGRRPRHRRRHDRLRYGRGQAERPLGRPRRDRRVAGLLLPGGRARGPRRRAGRGGPVLPRRGPRPAPLLLRRRPGRPGRDRHGARRPWRRRAARSSPGACRRRRSSARPSSRPRCPGWRRPARSQMLPDGEVAPVEHARRAARRSPSPPTPRSAGARSTARAWT